MNADPESLPRHCAKVYPAAAGHSWRWEPAAKACPAGMRVTSTRQVSDSAVQYRTHRKKRRSKSALFSISIPVFGYRYFF